MSARGPIAEKIAPLRWAVSDDAPTRINLLIPTIDLTHFFGGYIAKFNLARRLAERGSRVRIVTVDPVGPLPAGLATDGSSPMRASRASSTRSRSRSAANRRGSRSAGAIASSPPPGGPRTSPTQRLVASGSCT